MSKPLMPKATAVWLVENTSLSFEQIADFCVLHPLEVKGIADGDVAQGIKGLDPVAAGQITREEIAKGEADANYRLKMANVKHTVPEPKTRRGPRYTPVSRRQDRPNAIAWLVRYHPELTDAQISKLVGTTKTTIDAIRERTHWNMANIKAADPVTLGLCSQIELDFAVQKAAARVAKAGGPPPDEKGTLRNPAEILAAEMAERDAQESERALDRKARLDPEAFFKPRADAGENQ